MLGDIWKALNSFEFATPDPLVMERSLFGAPFKILLVNLAYLAFVFKIGPAFMKNREPYNLKKILLVYNFLQVVLNFVCPICRFEHGTEFPKYFSIAYLMIVHYRFYEVGCMKSLPNDHSHKYIEVYCFYVYYLIKFLDYLDTIFFVLRKSYRQVTFLHVYHHILMANGAYMVMRYVGFGGHIGTMGILNSVVHIFMYFYYFISALKPTMISAAWFKKYITRLQLTQFVIIVLHNLYPLIFRPDCNQRFICFFAMLQGSIMLYLFGKFYIKTYLRNGNNNQIVDKTKKQN